MAVNIGPKIGIDGEKEYRQQLTSIIAQAKTLDTEMKALTASFTKNTSEQEKNAKTTEVLRKQIEKQQELVDKLAKGVEESAKKYGENAVETEKWKQQLNKAQGELNGMQSRLADMDGGLEDVNEELDEGGKKTSRFADLLKSQLLSDAIVGGIKALASAMEAVGKATVNVAKEVVAAYGEFEQLEGGVYKLFGEEAAQQVIQNASRAYKSAGMSMNEYMETVTGFSAALIKSLGGDTEKAAAIADRAVQDMSDNANTFGTDMATIQAAYSGFAKQTYTMLDSLNLGYGGTKAGMEALILDAEKLDTTFKATRATNGDLEMSFNDIVRAIGIVQDSMNITGTTSNEASRTVQGSISSMKSAMQNFVIGLGRDSSDIDMLLNNVVESFQDVVRNVQPILERFIDYIPGVIGAVIPVLQRLAPELIQTAVGIFNSLLEAIISVLPDLIPIAVEAIKLIANTLIQNLPTIIAAGVQLIVALVNGFAEALPALIEQAPMIISTLATAIIQNLPTIISAGMQIIQALINGLISTAGSLPQIAYDILLSIKDTFAGGVEAAWGWGRDLIINFANGIIEHTKAVWSSVKNVAQSIWDLLHFSEPETGPLKDFHTYAPDMMRTFAKGISQNQHLVTEATSRAMQGVSDAMTVNGPTNNAYNYGGFNISIYQQPGQSSDDLVNELMYKMQNRIDARKAVYDT